MRPFVPCLLDSREVRLFSDLRSLKSAVEAADVLNGEYRAYDSIGCEVSLSVDATGTPRATLSTISRPTQLRDWILEAYQGASRIADSDSLPEMIHGLAAIYRFSDKEPG